MALPPPVPNPPAILPPEVARFYASGGPTADQVRFERLLFRYLQLLQQNMVPLNASKLPTSDPHVAGEVWNNAGVLTVSAG